MRRKETKNTAHAMKFSKKTISLMLIILAVMNIVDAFATLYFVGNGYARELNPFMAMWLEMGEIPFLLIKLLLVSIGIGFLWYAKEYKLVHRLIVLLLILYSIIILIHFDIACNIYYMANMVNHIQGG